MMTISLPPEVEAMLAEEARRRGTTPELLAVDCLRSRLGSRSAAEAGDAGASLLDFLSGYVGTVSGTAEALSERCGQRFIEGLVERERSRRS